MKTSIILLTICSLLSIVTQAQDDFNPDQASSDVIDKHFSNDEYTVVVKKSNLIGLPESLECGKDHYGNDYAITLANHLTLEQYGPGMYFSKIDADSLLINNSDGDQVSMIKMKVSELKALVAGKIPSLLALTADGFWWADGDHINGGTTVCSLATATKRRH